MVVYRHIRHDKNEPFYIGIGTSESRAYRKDGRNPIWKKIVNSTSYTVEILFDNLSKEDACKKEKEFISLYGRISDGTGCLSNITIGGDILIGSDNPMYNVGEPVIIDGVHYSSIAEASRSTGLHHKTIVFRIKSKTFPKYIYSDFSKNVEKIPVEKLSEYRRKNNPMYGKAHTEEVKKTISKKNKGRKKSELSSMINKVVKVNRREVIVGNNIYMSIGHAAHYLGVSDQVLSKALKKGYNCKGNVVKYNDSDTLYTKELVLKYFNKYPDKTDIYPHPKMIQMLKSL
jgi:hypothetical protein